MKFSLLNNTTALPRTWEIIYGIVSEINKLDAHVFGFRSMLENQVASTICENIPQSQQNETVH